MIPTLDTLKLVGAALLAAGVLLLGQKVMSWKDAADQNEQRGQTMTATDAIIIDGSASDEEREKIDAGVNEHRFTFKVDYEEDKRREPETAARADLRVPASLLNNYRARRLARDRLDCDTDKCRARLDAEAAAQR